MYILSFNLKEQLLLLLQNVNEVKQSTPALYGYHSAMGIYYHVLKQTIWPQLSLTGIQTQIAPTTV